MKKLLLLTLMITVSLNARLNPFEPTAEYLAMKAKEKETQKKVEDVKPLQKADMPKTVTVKEIPKPMVEKEMVKEIVKPLFNADDGSRSIAISADGNLTKEMPVKVIIKEVIVKEKLTPAQLAANCAQCKVIKPIKIMVKKPLAFVPKTYRVTPYLSITINKTNVIINTSKRNKIVKFMVEDYTDRFVIDFQGSLRKKVNNKNFLNNKYFKGYKVGNHDKYSFFRVVILNKVKNINKYKVNVTNSRVKISR